MVEYCIAIAEVMGSNPVHAGLDFLTARPWAGAVLNLPDVFFNRAAMGRRGS